MVERSSALASHAQGQGFKSRQRHSLFFTIFCDKKQIVSLQQVDQMFFMQVPNGCVKSLNTTRLSNERDFFFLFKWMKSVFCASGNVAGRGDRAFVRISTDISWMGLASPLVAFDLRVFGIT